jgi:dihydrofolate reductase
MMSPGIGNVRLTAVAAMARNRVIGRGGSLPWHLPDDLRAFKKLTRGHTVLMGRQTWESLPVRPLPQRRNLVLSTSLRDADVQGATVIAAVDALQEYADDGEIFVIGGAKVYESLLPYCQRLVLTFIPKDVEGDTFFPPFEGWFDQGRIVQKHPDFEIREYRREAGRP